MMKTSDENTQTYYNYYITQPLSNLYSELVLYGKQGWIRFKYRDALSQDCAFYDACYAKDMDAIRYFAQKVDINLRRGICENTILQSIASRGIIEVARLLIELRADVNQADRFSKTPLSDAVDNGHLEMIRLLVDYGADLNKQDKYGQTLLHRFISHDFNPSYNRDKVHYFDTLALLIELGADVSIKDNVGKNIFNYLLGRNDILLQLLALPKIVQDPCCQTFLASEGNLALAYAVRDGNFIQVEKLLNFPSISNSITEKFKQALIFTAKQHHYFDIALSLSQSKPDDEFSKKTAVLNQFNCSTERVEQNNNELPYASPKNRKSIQQGT